MSYSDIKPRPRPKTEAEWREVRREMYSNAGSNGGFRFVPSKVLDSDAFNELSNGTFLRATPAPFPEITVFGQAKKDHLVVKKNRGRVSFGTVFPLKTYFHTNNLPRCTPAPVLLIHLPVTTGPFTVPELVL